MSNPSMRFDAPLPLIEAATMAEGDGWRVRRVICRAGRDSPRAEEHHEWTGVAVVASGTFTYRSDAGSAVLAPGALLLANADACFECGHEHGTGDTCISFQFAAHLVESAFARFPRHARPRFPTHVVPPTTATLPLTARAAHLPGSYADIEELALHLLDLAVDVTHESAYRARPDIRDEGKVARLLCEIADAPHDDWSLARMARQSELDPFRLIRAFKRVAHTTPYQYVLRQRLEAAARLLLQGHAPVQQISLDCGFNDLSEFNRRFRACFHASPTEFRQLNARA